MAKNVKELRKWNFTRNLKYRKPRQIMSVPGLVPKHQEMRLNWHYVYPPWARGLEDEALGTMPKEFCPRRSLKSGPLRLLCGPGITRTARACSLCRPVVQGGNVGHANCRSQVRVSLWRYLSFVSLS